MAASGCSFWLNEKGRCQRFCEVVKGSAKPGSRGLNCLRVWPVWAQDKCYQGLTLGLDGLENRGWARRSNHLLGRGNLQSQYCL